MSRSVEVPARTVNQNHNWEWSTISIVAFIAMVGFGAPYAWSLDLPDDPPELPTMADQWINSSPLSYEQAKGKGIIFWYFEERCPKCARKWPKLMEQANQAADLPVLFVAVNSGCSRSEVVKYVRDNKIDWPVIVDPDRSFEAASGGVKISLKSICSVRIVKPDGSYYWGWWNDIPKTVEYVSEGGKWKLDHSRFPEEFKTAVRRLEFGDYLPAAAAIKSGMSSDSPGTQRIATFMQKNIQKQMKAYALKQLSDTEEPTPWQKFEALEYTAERFAPHKLPPEEAKQLEELSNSPTVLDETRARAGLKAVKKLLSGSDPKKQDKAIKRLKRVTDRYPKSIAASEANELMQQLQSGSAEGASS